jgi:hypothetical protein
VIADLSADSLWRRVMTAGKRARHAIVAGNASGVIRVGDVLKGHVQLDLQCLDRTYLNG